MYKAGDTLGGMPVHHWAQGMGHPGQDVSLSCKIFTIAKHIVKKNEPDACVDAGLFERRQSKMKRQQNQS